MPIRLPKGLPARLMVVLAIVLVAWGAFVGLLAQRVATENEHEALQRLSYGLAGHIVKHWPELGGGTPDDPKPRQELLRMLMTVNPGIQVYVLDPAGRVQNYIGEPGMVRQPQVDTTALRAFLSGAPLPHYGTDPMGGEVPRLFSAAMFSPSQAGKAGYLYIVLDGPDRNAAAAHLSQGRIWRGMAWAAAAGLVVALLGGALAVRALTRPLQRLAQHMAAFELPAPGPGPGPGLNHQPLTSMLEAPAPVSAGPSSPAPADEITALAFSFERMRQRLASQHEQQQRQATAHREVIANVAHDLRTPLTALHGHLEALRMAQTGPHVLTALAQSDKLRRLTQQLFELATLQSMDQVLHSERFRLDELVADAVHKCGLLATPCRVKLAGAAPGAVELQGDLHLIERALTNLIDNAVRHAPSTQAVQVSLQCTEREVSVLVEDSGPGLPEALRLRLDAGTSVRDPAVRRHAGGGMGGLGLAIAQRIAALHGGRLHTLPAPKGGTRLCMALPREPLTT
jgi:signal transduction histidine kinase